MKNFKLTGRVLAPHANRRADELVELTTSNFNFFENYIFKKQTLIRKLKRRVEKEDTLAKRKLYETSMNLTIQGAKYLAAQEGYDWQVEFPIGVRQEAAMKLLNHFLHDKRW